MSLGKSELFDGHIHFLIINFKLFTFLDFLIFV